MLLCRRDRRFPLKTWQRPTLPCLKTKYHRRRGLSRPSSGWDRVGGSRYDHQVIEGNLYFLICISILVHILKQCFVYRACRYAWAIKPIERLVQLSFTCYHASTCCLSTWWSSTALIGKPSFEGSFPLRCIQRLSRPYVATRRCRWRDNRYTRGMSIPVLSY